jgi:hypothetical protein
VTTPLGAIALDWDQGHRRRYIKIEFSEGAAEAERDSVSTNIIILRRCVRNYGFITQSVGSVPKPKATEYVQDH